MALTQKGLARTLSKPMNKIPEKFVPKKFAITTRLPETKYSDLFFIVFSTFICHFFHFFIHFMFENVFCLIIRFFYRDTLQCSVVRSGVNGNIYLCCATPFVVTLFQWYEPLEKFFALKTIDMRIPYFPLPPFQLIYSADTDGDFPKVNYSFLSLFLFLIFLKIIV